MADSTPAIPPDTSLLFIDGTNLSHRIHSAFQRDDIHFTRFFSALSADTNLIGTHYFSSPYIRRENQGLFAKQQGELNVLRTLPNVTLHLGRYRLKSVRCRRCRGEYEVPTEKATDVNLASHLIHAACHKRAARMIVVTGDNDFAPAIELARREGVHISVAFVIDPNYHEQTQIYTVDQLRRAADRYVKVNQQFMTNCWKN